MSDMLFAWLLVCCGAVLCQVKDTSRIQIINERDTWWEAHRQCKDNGGRLYTPGTDDIPEELLTRLLRHTYYWVGAMANRAWRWTVDESPLFTYAGFLPLGSVEAEPKGTYLDNSVWKCHLHCSPAYSVGMKGTTCYCLGEEYNTINTTTPEKTCPGNWEEKCGNMHGMSVYKLENMMFNQKEDTYCAYVEDTDLSIHTRSHDDCKNKADCYACFALSYASARISCTPQESWRDAWNTCDLVKLNASVRTSLLGRRSTNRTYWIGLYKYLQMEWINGKTALKYDGYLGASPSGTRCLTVYKKWLGGKSFYWRPCSDNMKSLCEDVNIPSSSSDYSATTETSYMNIPSSSSDYSATTETSYKGGYIVLGIGYVLLVPVVVYLLRRQKKTLFQRKKWASSSVKSLHFSRR